MTTPGGTVRFFDLGIVSPEYSVAADRLLFGLHSSGRWPDMMYVYRRDSPAVSLGRFGDDVDAEAAERDGVRVVRRISGGSAIYSDPGQMTFCVIMGGNHLPEDRTECYRQVCGGLIGSLGILGIDAEFKPVNDVLIGGRKVSGSAMYRDRGSVMVHGSLILDTPGHMTGMYLRRSKPRTYPGTTSVLDALGYVPDMDTVKGAMVKGFSDALGREISVSELGPEERLCMEDAGKMD